MTLGVSDPPRDERPRCEVVTTRERRARDARPRDGGADAPGRRSARRGARASTSRPRGSRRASRERGAGAARAPRRGARRGVERDRRVEGLGARCRRRRDACDIVSFDRTLRRARAGAVEPEHAAGVRLRGERLHARARCSRCWSRHETRAHDVARVARASCPRRCSPRTGASADVVYWDPFSPRANPALWTMAAFTALRRACREGATVHTYSGATATRIRPAARRVRGGRRRRLLAGAQTTWRRRRADDSRGRSTAGGSIASRARRRRSRPTRRGRPRAHRALAAVPLIHINVESNSAASVGFTSKNCRNRVSHSRYTLSHERPKRAMVGVDVVSGAMSVPELVGLVDT